MPRIKHHSLGLFLFITTWLFSIFHHKFWQSVSVMQLSLPLPFQDWPFSLLRGRKHHSLRELRTLWSSLISRISYLFLSPFPNWIFYCLCLQKIDPFSKTIMWPYFRSLFIFISLVIYNKRNLWLLLKVAYSEGVIHFAALELKSINVIFTQHRFI